jgi:GNAT superfamily N-acetyltransferase
LWRSRGEPEKLYQGVTGVLREYRRRGIATALKVKTIEYARNHGYRFIVTQNASVNAEMLALNEKLGFKRSVGIITMERKIATCSKG